MFNQPEHSLSYHPCFQVTPPMFPLLKRKRSGPSTSSDNRRMLLYGVWSYLLNSLQILVQLPPAAPGPVVTIEGGLDPRRHDAAQRYIISTVIGLTVMLHTQPEDGRIDNERTSMISLKLQSTDTVLALWCVYTYGF